MNSADPVASLSRVSVRFGRHPALRDVSLELRPGDFVALAGANGSGKTTILRLLLGFVRPAAGDVRVFGQPVAPGALRALRRRIGYVPQSPAVDVRLPLSVRDVVAIGRCARTGPGRRLGRDDRAAIAASLDAIGIAHLADRPFGHLSGGERQKAQIARALCQEPDLMLLDEPTSSLDLGARCECLDLLARIHRDRALTMLLVMHDIEALPRACTRALVVDRGALVFDADFRGLLRAANLRHIYRQNAPRVLRELRLAESQAEEP
ncbi:MAG: ABC transporter ATP-binding protein [Lentisphaeria bacterium]|nr:ABC transporter ATP-binding protein [Lentisphaeria bacterium]